MEPAPEALGFTGEQIAATNYVMRHHDAQRTSWVEGEHLPVLTVR